MWAVGGYVAVLLSSQLASKLATVVPLTEILNLLGSTAPVFSNSAGLNWFTFSILIAFVETYAFFVIALDILCSMFSVEIDKRNLYNPKMWIILFSLSFLFMMYHVTSKGVQSEATLILVFFMAMISLISLIWTKDARGALGIHIIANGIASASIFGIFKIQNLIIPIIHLIS